MPDGAGLAALIALIAGAAIELLSRTGRARFVPSSVVIGLAFLLPAEISAAIAVGAILGAVAGRGRPELGPPIAAAGAGAIAGESVLGVLLAALAVSGLL